MVQCFWPVHGDTGSRAGSYSLQQSLLMSFTGQGSDNSNEQVGFQQHRPGDMKQLRKCVLPSFSLRGKRASLSRHNKLQSANSFEATAASVGNIRKDLACCGIGSINWSNLAALGESLHDEQLRQVLHEPDEDTDWVGEPAWEDSFDGLAGKNAKRMHHRMRLRYFGGQAVAHIPNELWCNNNSRAGKL